MQSSFQYMRTKIPKQPPYCCTGATGLKEPTLSTLSSHGKNNNIKNYQLRANPSMTCKHFNAIVISDDPRPQTPSLPLSSLRLGLLSHPSLSSPSLGETARRVPGLRPLSALTLKPQKLSPWTFATSFSKWHQTSCHDC